MPLNPQFIFGLVLIIAPLAFFWRYLNRMFRGEKDYSRSPFSEKLLRPPGEGLRVKIGEIEDQMMNTGFLIAVLFTAPGALVMVAPLQSSSGMLIMYLSIPCACYAAGIVQCRKLFQLRIMLRNYRLGFDGERYIGAELNRLGGDYHVFHDFVYDRCPGGDATNFNIDHIVVGPNGIFAIETKARRKRYINGDAKGYVYEVTYDGASLDFSSGHRSEGELRQARDAAKTLAEWLNGASASQITVQPVIAIPGWMVKQTEKGDVTVLSGKNIAQTIPTLTPSKLDRATIANIASRIEDHCRNLEGE